MWIGRENFIKKEMHLPSYFNIYIINFFLMCGIWYLQSYEMETFFLRII